MRCGSFMIREYMIREIYRKYIKKKYPQDWQEISYVLETLAVVDAAKGGYLCVCPSNEKIKVIRSIF